MLSIKVGELADPKFCLFFLLH